MELGQKSHKNRAVRGGMKLVSPASTLIPDSFYRRLLTHCFSSCSLVMEVYQVQ